MNKSKKSNDKKLQARIDKLEEALDGVDSIVMGGKLAGHIHLELAETIEARIQKALRTKEPTRD